MAGLESLTGDDPEGAEAPIQGDNRIRELTQKAKESMSKEHTLSGIHAIMSGLTTGSERPAAGNKGRFYLYTASDKSSPYTNVRELQWDNGSSWETITKNEQVIKVIADLLTHRESNAMDHAASSVLHTHLISGILRKKHFDSTQSNNNESVSSLLSLIDGSEVTLHSHDIGFVSNGRPTFLSTKIEIGSGTTSEATPVVTKTITLSSGDVPVGAVSVILEAYGKANLTTLANNNIFSPGIRIKGRLSGGSKSDWLLLIGGNVVGDGGTREVNVVGWNGQGVFPITTASADGVEVRKIDYEVTRLNYAGSTQGWEIRLVGYI